MTRDELTVLAHVARWASPFRLGGVRGGPGRHPTGYAGAAVTAILGKIPTRDEYLHFATSLKPLAGEIYRYLNELQRNGLVQGQSRQGRLSTYGTRVVLSASNKSSKH